MMMILKINILTWKELNKNNFTKDGMLLNILQHKMPGTIVYKSKNKSPWKHLSMRSNG